MKKISFVFSMLLISLATVAQQHHLNETIVTPPQFNGEENVTYDKNTSMFNQFANNSLQNINSDNGVVVVLFTIDSDGSVSNINLLNTVSNSTNQAVIKLIEKSSGLWTPGKVNGTPVAMEKEIHVKFNDPSGPSLEDLANQSLEKGLKNYQMAMFVKQKFGLTQEQADNKSEKKLNRAVKYLEIANKYQPQEPSIIFWQACIYKEAGKELESAQKMNRFHELNDTNYMASTETVIINLK